MYDMRTGAEPRHSAARCSQLARAACWHRRSRERGCSVVIVPVLFLTWQAGRAESAGGPTARDERARRPLGRRARSRHRHRQRRGGLGRAGRRRRREGGRRGARAGGADARDLVDPRAARAPRLAPARLGTDSSVWRAACLRRRPPARCGGPLRASPSGPAASHLATGRRVIQTLLSAIFCGEILNLMRYTERRLNDSTARGLGRRRRTV